MTLSSEQLAVINDNTSGDITPADIRTALNSINDVLVNDATDGTAYGRAFLGLANQAALVALLPAYQPSDSDLTAIAALTTTAYGRALLELADQAALMALLSSATTSAEGKVELATAAETQAGTDTTRAVTAVGAKSAAMLRACRVLSFNNVTISTALNAGDILDGVTLADGDRVLVIGQTSTLENGIYVAGAVPARAADMATGMAVESSTCVIVQEGGLFKGVYELTTDNPVTVNTTGQTWTTLRTTLAAQPVDADLTSIAALTTTTYGRALLTLADQAALTAQLTDTTNLIQSGATTRAFATDQGMVRPARFKIADTSIVRMAGTSILQIT